LQVPREQEEEEEEGEERPDTERPRENVEDVRRRRRS